MFFENPEEEKKIYDLENFSALIEALKIKTGFVIDEIEYAEKYSIRYLITPKWDIVFAPEGHPSYSIPGHREMNKTCLAAGNLVFDKDFKTIVSVNNQSGDFKPSMTSIILSLIMLNESGLKLKEPLTVILYGEESKAICFELSMQDLTEFSDVFQMLKQDLLNKISENQQAQLVCPSMPR